MNRLAVPQIVTIIGITIVLSLAVAIEPAAAASVAITVFIASLAARYRSRLPKAYLSILAVCLIGYAFLGRGFAYIGVQPLYIGELVLVLGLLSLFILGGLLQLLRSPLVWCLVTFMIIGITATIPYVGDYGLDAFRDAVLWGYGLFAILVAAFLLKSGLMRQTITQYGRVLPWFLAWTPVAVITYRFAGSLLPKLPGSAVPLLNPKGGDIAVHLAGTLAFLVLGLHGEPTNSVSRRSVHEWIWWLLWLLSCLSVFTGRAAILTIAVVALVLMLLRPLSRWGKGLFLIVLLGSCFVVFDIEIKWTDTRSVSTEDIILTLQSIFGETGESVYDGSRKWRLQWWSDILGYTVQGEYFWTGKGFGVNLADADGYQVTSDRSLRSPHNGHMTILARSGVPGAMAWLVLQAAMALSLIRAYVRARRQGWGDWAKLNVWLLAYWLAFMVNGTFDVYLEGPQGGIWFWAVFGTAIAALEMQRRGLPLRAQGTKGDRLANGVLRSETHLCKTGSRWAL